MLARVRLTDALHARPASLLVRLAQRFEAHIEVRKGARIAAASRILEVLGLGAVKGDEVEVVATGDDADAAVEAVRELVERGFLADLVPEAAAAAVEGIAVGCAFVVTSGAPPSSVEPAADDNARIAAAFARAKTDLDVLIASLPREEAELFEPEVAILAELEPAVARRVRAGESAAAAIAAETETAATDLILDARARLLETLASSADGTLRKLAAVEVETVLVTDALTPSMVAALPPSVVGIVATASESPSGAKLEVTALRSAGFASHAAILARGRGVPLAYVPQHVATGIVGGDVVVLDTTTHPASVWVSPTEVLVAEARARRADRAAREAEAARIAAAPLDALGVTVRVNVSSLDDAIPEGADGIGLVRTELVFAGRHAPPSETEQFVAALTLARRARGGPVVARLFDAGGDKPIPWLPPPPDDLDARGIGLLFAHPDVLAVQVRALARAAQRARVAILLPLVRSTRDVDQVRRLAASTVEIGAMVETPEAVDAIDVIAKSADFICVGTNDLSAALIGESRERATLSRDPRLFRAVARIVEGARAAGRSVTVCGEIAGDPDGARILVGLGVNAISVSPSRLVGARQSLASASRDDCARAAREAMQGP